MNRRLNLPLRISPPPLIWGYKSDQLFSNVASNLPMSVAEAVFEQDSISVAPRADRACVGRRCRVVGGNAIHFIWQRGMLPSLSGTVVPFELQATDVGGQMHIRWNPRADDVARAEHAVFEVADGKKQYRFPVSRAVLASGTMEYTRKSDDVAATLVLYKDGRETERRTVRSVSAPGTP